MAVTERRCYTGFLRPDALCELRTIERRSAAIRRGEVSEWLKEHAWKACSREIVTWVRIPPSPPVFRSADPAPMPRRLPAGGPSDPLWGRTSAATDASSTRRLPLKRSTPWMSGSGRDSPLRQPRGISDFPLALDRHGHFAKPSDSKRRGEKTRPSVLRRNASNLPSVPLTATPTSVD